MEAPEQAPSPVRRRRMPWAQLLRRLLHIDALACPRCSTSKQTVAMVVLAFLTDPDVVGRILRYLGLPTCAPALAAACSTPCQQLLMQHTLSFSSPGLACARSEDRDVSGVAWLVSADSVVPEADRALLWLRGLHEFSDGVEDDSELRVVLLQGVELSGQVDVGG